MDRYISSLFLLHSSTHNPWESETLQIFGEGDSEHGAEKKRRRTKKKKKEEVGEEKKKWFMGSGHGLLWGKFLAFLNVFMLPIVYLARKSCVWFGICLDSDSRFILVWISVFVRL